MSRLAQPGEFAGSARGVARATQGLELLLDLLSLLPA